MIALITGKSGFLGSYLEQAALRNNHVVQSLGRAKENDLIFDLSVEIPILPASIQCIVHAAGKAHVVPKTEKEKDDFFQVNVQGTKNLITSIEQSACELKSFVFISTVAVYGKEYGANISESHPLEGHSPYAKSKIQAEEILINWSKKSGVPLLILRLPLVIGDGAKGNLAKMINGIKRGKYVSIGSGAAKKSMVMAEDVATMIWNNLDKSGIYNLTDGYHPSFGELEKIIANQLDSKIRFRLPILLAKIMGQIGNLIPNSPVNSELIKKMTLPLVFNDDLARKELNWQPKKVLEKFRVK
jgi:nucleoside-diphosphate-sugar epimerase